MSFLFPHLTRVRTKRILYFARGVASTPSRYLGPTLPPSADGTTGGDKSQDHQMPSTAYMPASALPPELDLAFGQHVALQMSSAQLYLALHAWFGRPDVGLRGMHEYYAKEFKENVR